MSKLYGRMNSDARRTQLTSTGRRSMSAQLETWQGKLRIELDDSGTFEVTVSGKHDEDRITLAFGNLDTRKVSAIPFPVEYGAKGWEISSANDLSTDEPSSDEILKDAADNV